MKENLKRILPILLALLVVCSVVWYLFVYDRDFTRDMLVKQARFFEQQGNQSVAAWLYNQAYIYSGSDDHVAIELAEQFVSIGDFTKAERTLSKAIADGGSVELYVALCKTYVAQDKLKDAVTMLDNVGNPEIKAQLDELRPALPTVTPSPGFYNEYIPVRIKTDGTLYLTTDLRYPSTANGVHDGNVTLVGGENTIRAVSINESGLVSPVAVFGYTIQGVIQEVTLADTALEGFVRQQLQIPAGTALYTNDLWKITSLLLPKETKTSADLSYLTSLKTLTVEGSTINDWSSLSALTGLTELTMRNCILSTQDLLAISSLPKLETLTLTNCNLSSIENLASAKHLKYLNLSNNAIRDLKPLSFISGLQTLDLNHNALENLTSLSSLDKLEILNVSNNSLASALPLTSCSQLVQLNISHNSITSLSGLEGLKNLKKLNASFNTLSDVSTIGACTSLTELDLSSNSIADISALSALSTLETLSFSRNQVSTLPSWSKSSALVSIDGSHNSVKSLSPLANCQKLNDIIMDYNKITSVKALSTCPSLVSVSVYGNSISDVSVLKDMSIIVNYTPKT